MSDGWTKFSEVTVSKVKSAEARQAVIAHINELGRIIRSRMGQGFERAKDHHGRPKKLERSDGHRAAERRWQRTTIMDALKAVRRMAENRRSRDGV